MPEATPPSLRKRRKAAKAPPPPVRSGRLLARLAPEHTALFRFLLEAYDNLAYFTVLESRTALLKIVFAPQREAETREALAQMAQSIPFSLEDWPWPPPENGARAAANKTQNHVSDEANPGLATKF